MNKLDEIAKDFRKRLIGDGHTKCELCSTENWEVYHTNEDCPKKVSTEKDHE